MRSYKFKDGNTHRCIQFTQENLNEIMDFFEDDDRIEYDGKNIKLYTDTIFIDEEEIIEEGDLFYLYEGDWIILIDYDENDYSIEREFDEVFQDLIVKD